MLEKEIEMRLVKATKARGGLALKFISPGFAGMPDRLILFPGGGYGFVEVKGEGKIPRPLQLARHEMLRSLGAKVYVLDSKKQIEEILDAIQSA